MINNRLLNITIIIIISNVIILSIFSNHWGYDEFGAVVTQIELTNPAYQNEYKNYLEKLGINNEYLSEILINYLMPIFVVPIRWTYAIGISPSLYLANYLPIEWQYLRPILMIPYVFLMAIGLFLIKKSLVNNLGFSTIFLFYLLIFSSNPLLYWANTFTSYSHHIFIFGIILYASLKYNFNGHIFNKKSILFAIVPLFNYQYIPIIGLFFLIDTIFIKSNKKFIFIFKSWLLSGIICLVSTFFLFLRGIISSKHTDPAFASLNSTEALFYSLPLNLKFSYESISHIISRYIDIIFSFYSENINNNSNYSWFYCTLFILLIIYIFKINWNVNKRIACILMIISGGTLLIHFFGLMHIAATRHQLVLFLPFSLLFSIWIGEILLKKLRIITLILMISLALILKVHFFTYFDNSFPYNYAASYFKSVGVERLVLNKCDYEPMLSADMRELYNPIYSCGPKIIQKLPLDVKKIAIWSSTPVEENTVKNIIGNYSSYGWSLSFPSDFESNNRCTNCSKLWIAVAIPEKR